MEKARRWLAKTQKNKYKNLKNCGNGAFYSSQKYAGKIDEGLNAVWLSL